MAWATYEGDVPVTVNCTEDDDILVEEQERRGVDCRPCGRAEVDRGSKMGG